MLQLQARTHKWETHNEPLRANMSFVGCLQFGLLLSESEKQEQSPEQFLFHLQSQWPQRDDKMLDQTANDNT